ncbi:MAG: agmatine deiminase family protein [Candidatus Hodarchaeota archaeon]
MNWLKKRILSITLMILNLISAFTDIQQIKNKKNFWLEFQMTELATEHYHVAYHRYSGWKDFHNIILITFPELQGSLTEATSQNVWKKVNHKFRYEIAAGQSGIHSVGEMAAYMKNIGILDKIGLTIEQAIDKMNLVNPALTYLSPVTPNKTPPMSTIKHFPAEFEPQGAILLAWSLYEAWEENAALIKEIKSAAKAYVLVDNEHCHRAAVIYLHQKDILDLQNVKFLYILSDSTSTRDCGPTSVIAQGDIPVFISSIFDLTRVGFPNLPNNSILAKKVGNYLNVPTYQMPLILEGGQILSDGAGTVFSMEEVLTTNDIDFQTLENMIKTYYGATRVIVFPPVEGSHGGHIDPLIKFVSQDTVIVAECPKWYNMYQGLEYIANTLANLNSQGGSGKPYQVVRIPIPKKAYFDIWGITQHSYVNALIVNNKVLVPIFGIPSQDSHALSIYRSTLPNHTVVGINFDKLKLGSIHCLTKEVSSAIVLINSIQ